MHSYWVASGMSSSVDVIFLFHFAPSQTPVKYASFWLASSLALSLHSNFHTSAVFIRFRGKKSLEYYFEVHNLIQIWYTLKTGDLGILSFFFPCIARPNSFYYCAYQINKLKVCDHQVEKTTQSHSAIRSSCCMWLFYKVVSQPVHTITRCCRWSHVLAASQAPVCDCRDSGLYWRAGSLNYWIRDDMSWLWTRL